MVAGVEQDIHLHTIRIRKCEKQKFINYIIPNSDNTLDTAFRISFFLIFCFSISLIFSFWFSYLPGTLALFFQNPALLSLAEELELIYVISRFLRSCIKFLKSSWLAWLSLRKKEKLRTGANCCRHGRPDKHACAQTEWPSPIIFDCVPFPVCAILIPTCHVKGGGS